MKNFKLRLILLACSSFVTTCLLAAPELYEKKPDITTDKVQAGDKTFFTFGFKDLDGTYQEWVWSERTSHILNKGQAFGLSARDPENFSYYPEELPTAMFKEHPQLGVIPDYSRLALYYQDITRPLFKKWKAYSQQKNLNQRESVELLLRFFQDYPYGVPPNIKENRFIAGLFVASYVFNEGYADCDSKALLMASVLSMDHYFRNRLAMILVPGHALLGINIRPSVYDATYSLRNTKYVVAEPTGLARTPLGRRNSPYDRILGIEPFSFSSATTTATNTIHQNNRGFKAPPKSVPLKILSSEDCPEDALLIDYVSPSSQRRVQMCQIKRDGQYIKHGPEVIFGQNGQPESIKNYQNGVEL